MGVMADIGERAGQVARGETSPKALLTTAGGLIVCDASGNPVQLAPGARGSILRVPSALVPSYLAKGTAAQVLGWDANDAVALTPPGFPFVDLGRSSTPSDTSEHSLLAANAATTGLFAAGVSVGDAWDVFLGGTLLNNSGDSTARSTLKLYYGAYVADSIQSAALTSNATSRAFGWQLRLVIETLGAAGTGTLRVSGRRYGLDAALAVGTGYRSTVGTGGYVEQVGTTSGTSTSPALITNAAQDFNVTATHNINAALLTTALTECVVRYYPKNR